MNKVRAYAVTETFEGIGCIVFAPSRNRAKAMVANSLWVNEAEYIDLSCKLAPKAEQYNAGLERVVSWDTREGQRVYYELGWGDREEPSCCQCGRSEFESIPESTVADRPNIDMDDLCRSCYQQELKERKEKAGE